MQTRIGRQQVGVLTRGCDVSEYLIAAVLRPEGCEDPSAERLLEIRVKAKTELAARRSFLEWIWQRHLLCSYVAGVTRLDVDQEA